MADPLLELKLPVKSPPLEMLKVAPLVIEKLPAKLPPALQFTVPLRMSTVPELLKATEENRVVPEPASFGMCQDCRTQKNRRMRC